jgi:hypothetical protein
MWSKLKDEKLNTGKISEEDSMKIAHEIAISIEAALFLLNEVKYFLK